MNWKPGKGTAFAVRQPSAEAMAKTVIMFAAPQIGKTGAYLHCCLAAREMIRPATHKVKINIYYLGLVKQKAFHRQAFESIRTFNQHISTWLEDQAARHKHSQVNGKKRSVDQSSQSNEKLILSGHDCYFYTELEEKKQDTIPPSSLRGLAAVFDKPCPLTAGHLRNLSSDIFLNAHSIIYIFTDSEREHLRRRSPDPIVLVSGPRPPRSQTSAEIRTLHQKYYKEDSQQLHTKFAQNLQLWTHYHDVIEQSQREKGLSITQRFTEVWYKKFIDTREEHSERETLKVGDMGCGRCQLAEKLLILVQDSANMDIRVVAGDYSAGSADAELTIEVHGVDHMIDSKSRQFGAEQKNMHATQWAGSSMQTLVFSLSLWGADRHMYIKEAHRVLRKRGDLFIIESKYRMGIDHSNYNNAAEVQRKCDEFAAEVVKRGFTYDREFNPAEFQTTPFICLLFCKTIAGNKEEGQRNQEAPLPFPKKDWQEDNSSVMTDD